MTEPRMSVIVPAHDEERVIGRLLERLVADSKGELDIVVVANGCHDATASVARGVDPAIRVLEIPAASKVAALNAGDAAARAVPRAYVDADIEIDGSTLLALGRELDEGPSLVASPALALDLRGSSRAVRAYYAVWELSEFRRSGHIGSGVYALSRAGRARFGPFPDVIGDDRFVRGLFAQSERATTSGRFTVRPPRTLTALVRRGGRIAAGDRQLRELGIAAAVPSTGSSLAGLAGRVATRPGLWMPFAVYCIVQLRTRTIARRKLAGPAAAAWDRDETSRV
jgi:glycosyltransferase involved in cell wall biosynthesis